MVLFIDKMREEMLKQWFKFTDAILRVEKSTFLYDWFSVSFCNRRLAPVAVNLTFLAMCFLQLQWMMESEPGRPVGSWL